MNYTNACVLTSIMMSANSDGSEKNRDEGSSHGFGLGAIRVSFRGLLKEAKLKSV